MRIGRWSLYAIGRRGLPWLAVVYAAGLWWIHHLVRDPFNLGYFKHYVALRCVSAAHLAAGQPPHSPTELRALGDELRRCEDSTVMVDGVWGGTFGRASVRLRVTSPDSGDVQMKYYSVEVNPLLGTASIRYESTPTLYYLNP